MRWQYSRILADAHNAMAERREEAVVAVVDAGGCCGGVSFSFVIFFSAGGAPNAGLVAIWEDASAIGVKVCVSQDRAPTHVAGGWCTVHSLLLETYSHHHDVATKIQAATRALAFTARAVCCSLDHTAAAHFCARQACIISGVWLIHFAQTSALPPSHNHRHSSHPAARDSRRVGHFTSLLMA